MLLEAFDLGTLRDVDHVLQCHGVNREQLGKLSQNGLIAEALNVTPANSVIVEQTPQLSHLDNVALLQEVRAVLITRMTGCSACELIMSVPGLAPAGVCRFRT